MNAKRKIIIDCDTGIDDALALMLALASPELEVIGITAVCGNVPVDIGVENIRKVLNVMNRLDIPVYRGEEKPLRREYISAQDTHGMDGLGESGYENVPGSAQEKDAVSYITDTLREKQGVSQILRKHCRKIRRHLNNWTNLSRWEALIKVTEIVRRWQSTITGVIRTLQNMCMKI